MSQARDRDLFERLAAETDESAAVRVFVDLCRSAPRLRTWLWEEFATNEAVRSACAGLLDSGADAPGRVADLGGGSSPHAVEARRIRGTIAPRLYGGLSFAKLKSLLVQHQAGKLDPAAFLLALQWRREANGDATPRRLAGAYALFARAMAEPKVFAHLGQAADLTAQFAEKARRRAVLGHTDWWKLHVLLFMLRHPAPSYRTREIRAHLASLGLRVTTRDVRRFCTQHGINRDMRAGRPLKPKASVRHTAAARTSASAPRYPGRLTASDVHRP